MGELLFLDHKLYGKCDIVFSNNKYKDTPCILDLATGIMEIQSGQPGGDNFVVFGPDSEVLLQNLALQTPFGVAKARQVENTFLKAVSQGGMWVGTTSLTYLFEDENKYFPTVKLLFNSPIELEWPCMNDEIIVTPGMDLFREITLPEVCKIVGRKGTLSILDIKAEEKHLVVAAVSLAIGAPVRILAETREGSLKLFLNTRRSELNVSPLFYTGWPHRELDLVSREFGEVFETCYGYLSALPKEKQVQFINAVEVFLEGKSVSSVLHIRLLAAYHFLEWFDDTKTLNWQSLSKSLSICREDAETLVFLRNGLVHNRRYLGDLVSDACDRLGKSNSPRFQAIRKNGAEITILNYLYSVCGEMLLKKIGYSGLPQDYLPTEKVEQNVH